TGRLLFMTQPDWAQWQRVYDRPAGALGQRLAIVQRLIRGFLAARGDDDLKVVSMCAGQGRDLLPVLAEHPWGRAVVARLAEADPPGHWASPVQGVGAHRWPHDPVPLEPGVPLFTFRSWQPPAGP